MMRNSRLILQAQLKTARADPKENWRIYQRDEPRGNYGKYFRRCRGCMSGKRNELTLRGLAASGRRNHEFQRGNGLIAIFCPS